MEADEKLTENEALLFLSRWSTRTRTAAPAKSESGEAVGDQDDEASVSDDEILELSDFYHDLPERTAGLEDQKLSLRSSASVLVTRSTDILTRSEFNSIPIPQPDIDATTEADIDETQLLLEAISKSNVVFIGAGPIGLWTAIQLKILRPDLVIAMFEKYKTFQRKHVLRIDPSSYKNHVADPRLDAILKLFSKVVRTSELEEKFVTLAYELGILIHFTHIQTISQIHQLAPMAKVVVGADGSHSILREEVFTARNFGLDLHESLMYIVDVKYEVVGQARRMRFVDQTYPTIKLMNHIGEEFVGKCVGNVTPVTLRLVIDEQTYRDASFKSPYFFNKDIEKIPKQLLESITIWLNAKYYLYQEQRVPGSERLSALNLSVYHNQVAVLFAKPPVPGQLSSGTGDAIVMRYSSSNFSSTKTIPNSSASSDLSPATSSSKSSSFPRTGLMSIFSSSKKSAQQETSSANVAAQDTFPSPESKVNNIHEDYCAYVLVGDALFGVPFFRSLNNGLLCGSNLSQAIDTYLGTPLNPTPLFSYQKFAMHLAHAEVRVARVKHSSFRLFQLGRIINRSVPWQINKWGGEMAKKLKETAPAFLSPDSVSTTSKDWFKCIRCDSSYIASANRQGSCKHSGDWHENYSDCSAGCVAGLALNGLGGPMNKISLRHWSCCYSVERHSTCPKSPPHIASFSVCVRCTKAFDPEVNPSGKCLHTSDWHEHLKQCSLIRCAIGLNSDIGREHWGCCFSLDKQSSECTSSPPHTAM